MNKSSVILVVGVLAVGALIYSQRNAETPQTPKAASVARDVSPAPASQEPLSPVSQQRPYVMPPQTPAAANYAVTPIPSPRTEVSAEIRSCMDSFDLKRDWASLKSRYGGTSSARAREKLKLVSMAAVTYASCGAASARRIGNCAGIPASAGSPSLRGLCEANVGAVTLWVDLDKGAAMSAADKNSISALAESGGENQLYDSLKQSWLARDVRICEKARKNFKPEMYDLCLAFTKQLLAPEFSAAPGQSGFDVFGQFVRYNLWHKVKPDCDSSVTSVVTDSPAIQRGICEGIFYEGTCDRYLTGIKNAHCQDTNEPFTMPAGNSAQPASNNPAMRRPG